MASRLRRCIVSASKKRVDAAMKHILAAYRLRPQAPPSTRQRSAATGVSFWKHSNFFAVSNSLLIAMIVIQPYKARLEVVEFCASRWVSSNYQEFR